MGRSNGIFCFILIDHPEAEVRELTNAGLFRSNVTPTFHGRDVFGPVAGALVRGTAFEDLGPKVEDVFHFEFPKPQFVEGGALEGHVIYVDVFGNLVTSLGGGPWEKLLQGVGGDLTEFVAEVNRVVVPVVSTFGDVPEDDACAYLGSAGRIEIAVNQGSAVERFEATIGPSGSVQDAKVLRSIPLLDQAALDAVRQWQFTPTLLNGVPVPVIMTVTVQFTLQ